nr:hypothetical protein [Shewanella ferrihydritica]
VQGIEINPDNNLEAEVYLKDHKRFLSEMNGWMSGSTKNMKAQVEETTQDFQELPSALVENAKQQLQLHYAQSMKELTGSSAP